MTRNSSPTIRADGIVFNDQPVSEEERKLIESWIIAAANFHTLPKEEQAKVLECSAAQFEADRASEPDPEEIEVVA